MGPSENRWPFLDLVRFGAALLVMFGHVRGFFFESIAKVEDAGAATKAFYVLTGIHHEAVVLFFVVSGFLIGGRAWALIEQCRFDWTRYCLDRFSRIYLVLIPALVLIGIIDALGSHFFADTRLFGVRPLEPAGITAGWSWGQVPCHLASLQSLACAAWGIDPPLWSLAFEWVFYFLAPLTLAACYVRVHLAARLSAIAIVAAGLVAVLPDPTTFALYFAVWFLGAVSARTLARTSVPVPLGLAGLMLAAACMVLSRAKVTPIVMTDAGIAVGLALALASRPIACFRIAEAVVRRGAGFSYSLYVLHVPVALLIGATLETLGWPRGLAAPGAAAYSAFAITCALTLAAAWLFARATEDHTAAFRRWLKRPFEARAAALAPGAAVAR
jgi:peptidoglycan/LPS O-acetylase OafA/YrhL